MKKLILIFSIFFYSLILNAQVGLIYPVGRIVSKEIAKSKKSKIAKQFTKIELINGDSIPVMRVPEDDINSKAFDKIIEVQTMLDTHRLRYASNKKTQITNSLRTSILSIKDIDKVWVIENYLKEDEAYFKYDFKIELEERNRSDSH